MEGKAENMTAIIHNEDEDQLSLKKLFFIYTKKWAPIKALEY